MTHWIRRGCWLLAWAAWLWFGVRLHRELPRDLGRPIRALPLEEGETLLGVFDGESSIATENPLLDESARIRHWDPMTGQLLRDVGPVPSRSHHLALHTPAQPIRHGYGIGNKMDGHYTLLVIDYRTGTSKELGPPWWQILTVHPRRPWIVVKTLSDVHLPPKVFVSDLSTMKRLFEWAGDPPKDGTFDHIGMCEFVAERDEVLILRQRVADGWTRFERQELLCFTLSGVEVRPPIRLKRPYGWMTPPAGVRVVVQGAHEHDAVPGTMDQLEVIDLESGRSLSAANADEFIDFGGGVARPRLSTSGRHVLTASSDLWDLDQRRVIWSRRPGVEQIVWTDESEKTFQVHEDWGPLFETFKLPFRWTSEAIRDLEGGRVVFRSWQLPFLARPENGPWAVDACGNVYCWPPRVNWVLLAACQALLALPLLFVWSFTRRRKRVAGVGP